MSTAVADLQAAVANVLTVSGNAISLLNQLFALAQANPGTLDPADAAAIEAQVALLNTQASQLGVTVTTDTPTTTASTAAAQVAAVKKVATS